MVPALLRPSLLTQLPLTVASALMMMLLQAMRAALQSIRVPAATLQATER